jgi:hypothetical protein
MPFCRDCGKEVQEEWTTCPFCSSSLNNVSKIVSVQDSVIMGDVNSTVNDSNTISSAVRSASKCVSCDSTGVIQIACSSCKNMAHCNVCESEVSMIRRKERICRTCAGKKILRQHALEKNQKQRKEKDVYDFMMNHHKIFGFPTFILLIMVSLLGLMMLFHYVEAGTIDLTKDPPEPVDEYEWGDAPANDLRGIFSALILGAALIGFGFRKEYMKLLESDIENSDDTTPKETTIKKISKK